MDFNSYQDQAATTRLEDADYEYLLMNLGGEVGELLSIEAKVRRDGALLENHFLNIEKELGDILWHVALIARDNGISLDDVAQTNLTKLASRKERGVLGGAGDNR